MEQLEGSAIMNNEQQDQAYSSTQWHNNLKVYFDASIISLEELKIWDELENEIEMDLEEEIKHGIYHLALRLHRLYQHKKARKKIASSMSNDTALLSVSSELVTMVNVTIGIAGGCKIKVNQGKRVARHMTKTRFSISEAKQGKVNCGSKDFDWTRSLRCGSLVTKGKKCSATDKAKKNQRHVSSSIWH